MVLLYFLDEIVTRYFKLYIIFQNSLIITVPQHPQDPGVLLQPLSKIVKSVNLYLKSSFFEVLSQLCQSTAILSPATALNNEYR